MAADAFAMLDTSTPTCPSPGPHPRCSFPDGGDDWPVGLAVTADFTHYPTMVALFLCLIGALRSALRTRADLALENLALRQQLANLRRTSGRPRLRRIDRAFWLALSRLLTAAELPYQRAEAIPLRPIRGRARRSSASLPKHVSGWSAIFR